VLFKNPETEYLAGHHVSWHLLFRYYGNAGCLWKKRRKYLWEYQYQHWYCPEGYRNFGPRICRLSEKHSSCNLNGEQSGEASGRAFLPERGIYYTDSGRLLSNLFCRGKKPGCDKGSWFLQLLLCGPPNQQLPYYCPHLSCSWLFPGRDGSGCKCTDTYSGY